MADIFLPEDMKSLLVGKRVVFIGDSNVRAMYKDWIWLIQNKTVIPEHCLKSKLERSVAGDSLLSSSALHRGRDFREVREYQDKSNYVYFMFVTKCISYNVKCMFAEFKSGEKPPPDIIIFNSCLWDVSRWGPDGVDMYKKNMAALMLIMHNSLPLKTLVLFTTTLPVSLKMEGAFLVPEVEFLKTSIPFDVMEANQFIRALVVAHGFDVVDLHFHLRSQLHRRSTDGVHWEPIVIRHLTNLLLTHISVSLGVELPGRARQYARMRIDCVESAKWIGHSVDPKLSEPVSTLTLEDIEVSGSCSPRLSSSESGGLPAEFDDLLPLDVSDDLSDGLPNVSNREKGTERNTSVMANLYEAPVKPVRNPRGGMSSRGFRQNSPGMGMLDNHTVQVFENPLPIMENLIQGPVNPVWAYGYGVNPLGVSATEPSYSICQGGGFRNRPPVKENQNIDPKHRGKISNQGRPFRGQNFCGGERKVALTNDQNSGPNYQVFSHGHCSRMQERGARGKGQNYQVEDRGRNERRRESEHHSLRKDRYPDYRAQDQGQKYLVQDQGQKYLVQDQGQKYRVQDQGQKYRVQDQGQKYRVQDQGQKYRAQDQGQKYRAQDQGQKYRAQDQGQKYRAQDQEQKYRAQKQRHVEVQQNYQEVLEQPWEGRLHIGGMHLSNFVNAPQPSATQVRYKLYSKDCAIENRRSSKKKICWP